MIWIAGRGSRAAAIRRIAVAIAPVPRGKTLVPIAALRSALRDGTDMAWQPALGSSARP
jgi:hypothetical protein